MIVEPFVIEGEPPWVLDYYEGWFRRHGGTDVALEISEDVLAIWMARELQHSPEYTRYTKKTTTERRAA